MNKKLKFALIGCGRVSRCHADSIKRIKEAELIAVCDLVQDKAASMAKEYQVKCYTNYHEMLSNEDLDVVNIITPSGMHAQHAIDIIRNYKKHIVVEKPMALRVQDCRNMIAAAKEQEVSLHVVMQNRFNKAVIKIKEAIEKKLFAKPVLGTVRLRWCRPQRYYDRDPWRGTWAFDGGVLANQAIHHIDLLRWLFGDVDLVSGIAATRLVDVEVEDTAATWLRFKNGALGLIEATTAARPDDLEASISILGENGTTVIEGVCANKIITWTFDKINLEEFSENPPTVYGFGHMPFLQAVVDSILQRKPSPISGEEGIKTVQLISSIYKSIEDGCSISMADDLYSGRWGVLRAEDEKIRNLYLTKKIPEKKKL